VYACRIMIAALKFFLGTDEKNDDGSESDSSDDDGPASGTAVQPNKEDVYKAFKKGTGPTKKKKQAKLKRVMQSLKKQQRAKEGGGAVSFAALQLLNDPQGFAEKLFARLRACSERFEVRAHSCMCAQVLEDLWKCCRWLLKSRGDC
jgi:protein SDA1